MSRRTRGFSLGNWGGAMVPLLMPPRIPDVGTWWYVSVCDGGEFDYMSSPCSFSTTFHPPRRHPLAQVQVRERRSHLRFDKVFTIYLSTQGGLVETRESMSLGERVKVTFAGEDGTEMTCLCEVRYQVALSYGRKDGREGNSRGVGLRIVAYEVQEDAPLLLVARERVMH